MCFESKIKESLNNKNDNLYHEKELTNNSLEELQKFTFEGYITKCKIVDVYDGDTVTIVFYYNDQPIKKAFRMYGYDSPEIRPIKSIENRNMHIEAGNISKKKLIDMVLNKILWVKFMNEEKFGRLMGELYEISEEILSEKTLSEKNKCINDRMIFEGYGKKYYGDKKENFTVEELLAIINKK